MGCEAGKDRASEFASKILDVAGRESHRAQAAESAESVKRLAPKFWQKKEEKEGREEVAVWA